MINVGVRIRMVAATAWTTPSALTAGMKFAFGLSVGTTVPYSSSLPTGFIGVTSGVSAWTRNGQSNWWLTGRRIIRANASAETLISSGSDGTLRVNQLTGEATSAWYLRVTKTSSTAVKIESFVPSGNDSPSEDEFLTQMRKSVWNPSIGGHSGYIQTTATATPGSPLVGGLDSVNVYSNIRNHVSSQLRGIAWLNIRSEILS